MRTLTTANRQRIGCGFMPAVKDAQPWLPAGFDVGDQGELAPTVCVGYTRQLPEVLEVGQARRHWDKGELLSFTGGAQPTPELVGCIALFDSAMGEVMAYNTARRKDGG
jgi:hypothetical protein